MTFQEEEPNLTDTWFAAEGHDVLGSRWNTESVGPTIAVRRIEKEERRQPWIDAGCPEGEKMQ